MRDMTAGLKKVASRGKLNTFLYIPIEKGYELAKKGCTVELICKGPSRAFFYVDWSKSTLSLGAELKDIADKATKRN